MRIVLVFLCASLLAFAQELRINGVRGAAPAPFDSVLEISVTGAPGLPTFLALNTNPGPTLFGANGQIPIGLDGREAFLILGEAMPASGVIERSLTVPNLPILSGLTVYAAAALLDPTAPDGLRVANAASFTFRRTGADAGQDGAMLAGQRLTLDGRASVVANDPLWIILDGPDGHVASLSDADTLLPALSANLPGTYVLELQTGGTSGVASDIVEVEVYQLSFASPLDGGFFSAPFAVNGSLAGPGSATLTIDGSPIPVGPTGAWSAGMQSAGAPQRSIVATITTGSGISMQQRVTVHGGARADVGALAVPGTAIRLNGATLDLLEPLVAQGIGAIPLNQVLTAIPPVQVVNTSLFSATFAFTNATYDPNVAVDIFPANGAIGISLTLPNLVITADITGRLFFQPYAEVATISATSVVLSAELVIGSNANNELEVQLRNETATLNGFNFVVTGALGTLGQVALIRDAIRLTLETALSGTLQVIPLTLNPVLSQIPFTVDLSAQGIPLALDFPLNAIGYDADGLTIAINLAVRSTSGAAPVVPLAGVLTTPSAVPGFSANTPRSNVPFDFALALNDDLFNQLFAGLTQAGTLEIAIDQSGGILGAPLSAAALAAILPGAGFETFPAGSPVVANVRNRVAPVLSIDPVTQGAVLRWGGAVLAFSVLDQGRAVPVLDLGFDLSAALAISLDPATGALTLQPGAATLSAAYEGGLVGSNAANLLPGLAQIAPALLQAILAPLQGLAIPTLGGAGGVVEIGTPTGVTDQLAIYFDTP